MTEKFTRWDSADYLKTEEDMALYFSICTEEDLGDGSLIRSALGAIARARDTEFSIVSESQTEEQTASYDSWFRAKVHEAIDSSAPRIPYDQVMAKMDALIATLKQK